jgi:hypothetical protein
MGSSNGSHGNSVFPYAAQGAEGASAIGRLRQARRRAAPNDEWAAPGLNGHGFKGTMARNSSKQTLRGFGTIAVPEPGAAQFHPRSGALHTA